MKNGWLIISSMLLIFIMSSAKASAQEFVNDAGEREKLFIAQVKQIEEFFERFNDDTASFIRSVYKSHNKPFTIERPKLIASLFNYEGREWRKSQIDSFVRNAIPVTMPTYDNWYGDDWYAEVLCKFNYNNSEINITLLLRLERDATNHAKWMIAGIKPNIIREALNPEQTIITRKIKKHFIHPASHGSNFIELMNAFNDKENLSDYFEKGFLQNDNGIRFYQALLNNRIAFQYVDIVKYHFLNVPGYIFQVEFFSRNTLNAGWLINKLILANDQAKDQYKMKLLFE